VARSTLRARLALLLRLVPFPATIGSTGWALRWARCSLRLIIGWSSISTTRRQIRGRMQRIRRISRAERIWAFTCCRDVRSGGCTVICHEMAWTGHTGNVNRNEMGRYDHEIPDFLSGIIRSVHEGELVAYLAADLLCLHLDLALSSPDLRLACSKGLLCCCVGLATLLRSLRGFNSGVLVVNACKPLPRMDTYLLARVLHTCLGGPLLMQEVILIRRAEKEVASRS
jgi:hypothetical protein